MTTRRPRYPLLLIAAILLAACAGPTSTPVDRTSAVNTPTRVIVRILDLSSVGSVLPTETPPPQSATSTPVVLPTSTPVPIQATVIGHTQKPEPTRCTNQAEFVRNLTISDNTALAAGQPFTKIWRIKNIGSCTWTTGYALIFFSGELMGGPARTDLTENVPPGATIDIRIMLTAPLERETYTGNWVLSDPDGNVFGLGQDNSQPLSVVIQIKPTPRPSPG